MPRVVHKGADRIGLELAVERLDHRCRSILAFSLMRGLQAGVAERRATNRKRRAIRVFETIHTLRYRWLNRAGLLVQPNGRTTLDVGNNPTVRERFQAVEHALGA